VSKIGKYDIVEELGRGGMGVVYKAHDSLMERDVAIKVMSDLMLAVPEIRQRFFREARTAGRLSHENITVVYDVGEDEGRPYIVMEYLTGNDLAALIEGNEPISFLQKLDYAIQICRGLSYSHANEIVHRDIKPQNIRIVGNGKVKIMDFGIARSLTSTMTTTGAVIGTPFYMSPEQIQGRHVDKRSDIFSFGVLFYELLTGKKPFTGDVPTAVMFKIVYDEPERIDDAQIDHRNGLRDVVMRTLAKDPDNRYQDLAEVADALENIVADLRTDERKRMEQFRMRLGKLIAESRTLLRGNKFRKARDLVDQAARMDPASTGDEKDLHRGAAERRAPGD
jgi:serine/threonine-protein kinase